MSTDFKRYYSSCQCVEAFLITLWSGLFFAQLLGINMAPPSIILFASSTCLPMSSFVDCCPAMCLQVLLDINLFLVPEEQDQRLLHLYLQSVLSGAVRRRRAPFFFLLAVHHVNRFLYHHGDHQHDEQRRTFWRCVLRCPKKVGSLDHSLVASSSRWLSSRMFLLRVVLVEYVCWFCVCVCFPLTSCSTHIYHFLQEEIS